MTINVGRHTFSVIIEWENAKLSELSRTRAMLTVLGEQIVEQRAEGFDCERIVVLYDWEAIEVGLIKTVLAETLPSQVVDCVHLIPTEDLRYYELKNHGARAVNSDFLVFLDSDVVPEPGWLAGLLSAVRQEGIDVVAGATYVEPQGLYAKAFALFWFFPLRDENAALEPATHFFANNVAFKRNVFMAHPFPSSGKFRGQCVDLAQTLMANGFGLWRQGASRVSHPPPNGPRHFMCRALCAGHDWAIQSEPRPLHRHFLRAWRRMWRSTLGAKQRIRNKRLELGMGRKEMILAIAIAVAYYKFVFLGEMVSFARPNLIPRYFPI